jgi:nucleolar pre-ribosomal-associated protein 1
MGKQGTYGQPSYLSSVTFFQKLHRLLYMRRRAKMTGSIDALAIPGLWVPVGLVARLKTSLDIRTLYILLIISFVDDSAASSVKSSFLEQRHDIFRSIFGGVDQDPYSLARKTLEVAWTGIWLDPKIKRTVKVNVFNEACLHLVRRISLALPASSRTTRF